MNDFTKEELNYIEELLSEHYEYFEGEEDEVWKLHDKVTLMIENYCDHNWDHLHPSGLVVCNECRKVYTDKP